MTPWPLRLSSGDDLRAAIDAAVAARGCAAAFVASGIGSLSAARIRYAGREDPEHLVGDLEILTLAGSVSPRGSHLHASLANADGRVVGGHVAPGCVVRTTAEVLLLLLDDWAFDRAPDAATGCAELTIRAVSR